ncbi:MAG TPA: histidine phosphatase family protein [Ktedonobacterales bacterium]|nr:histidine phosphatase family protein [Ktedonobacterales bacterium]
MSGATRFVLLRHGEAEGNRELRYLGSTDAPLTPEGERQAEQLARGLAGYPLAALYTSPLLRARRTAAIIGAALALPPVIEPALREQDFGAWENRTRAEVHAEAADRLAAWERGEAPPPDGESLAAVSERIVALANRLAALHAGEMVALASHVGPIKALVAAALGLAPGGAHRMWLDTASICVVEWRRDDDGRSSGMLRVFNATAHLDPPARWLRR